MSNIFGSKEITSAPSGRMKAFFLFMRRFLARPSDMTLTLEKNIPSNIARESRIQRTAILEETDPVRKSTITFCLDNNGTRKHSGKYTKNVYCEGFFRSSFNEKDIKR